VFTDYLGKKARLTDERMAHIIEHPEMANMVDAVEETLLSPHLVIRSGSDGTANLNYRYYYGT
jgi:hypothetical protein